MILAFKKSFPKYFLARVQLASFGIWSLLFWNFLSAGGRTWVSERKCIRMNYVRLRKISHSAKVLECLLVVNFDISIKTTIGQVADVWSWTQMAWNALSSLSLSPGIYCAQLLRYPRVIQTSSYTWAFPQSIHPPTNLYIYTQIQKYRKKVGRCAELGAWRLGLKLHFGSMLVALLRAFHFTFLSYRVKALRKL